MVALFEDGPNLVKAAGAGRTSGMGGMLRLGQLMNGIEDQQNQADKEAEAAPILEVIVPAGRHGQRQNGKDSQQKNHPNLRNLFHDSDPGTEQPQSGARSRQPWRTASADGPASMHRTGLACGPLSGTSGASAEAPGTANSVRRKPAMS